MSPVEYYGKKRARSTADKVRILVPVAAVLGLLGVVLLLANGGSSPDDPYVATARSPFRDFDETRLTVRPGIGLVARLDEACALLATTPEQQQKGMMGQSDFGGYPAMVFVFSEDSTSSFFNRRVPIALSVAWFAADGSFISAQDLEPCADVDTCPTVGATAPFRYAIELKKGGLAGIGVGPGSAISVTPGCGG